MKFDIRDVDFEPFSGSGPGGQFRNRHKNCVRATHRPTGIVVTATKQRSLEQNKAAAVEELQARLARLAEDRRAAQRRQRYDDQPDAAFGHAIRTCRMCGNDQSLVDHRTGVRITLGEFHRGRIDPLIEANLRSDQ